MSLSCARCAKIKFTQRQDAFIRVLKKGLKHDILIYCHDIFF